MKVLHGEDGKAGYLVDVGVDRGSTSFIVAVSFCRKEEETCALLETSAA